MAQDFVKGDDGDLVIINGNFKISNSDQDHIESILKADKGDFKQFPTLGLGIFNLINSPVTRSTRSKLERDIRLQLESDGFTEIKTDVPDLENISINAIRNE